MAQAVSGEQRAHPDHPVLCQSPESTSAAGLRARAVSAVSLPRKAWIRAELGGAAQLLPQLHAPEWAGGHCFVCALLTTTWRPQGWHSQ